MELSERIKAARKSAKMTQKELASRINKSFSTVQKYELGLATPPIDVLTDISRALNVPAGQLMGYEDMGGGLWAKEAPDSTWSAIAENVNLHNGHGARARLNSAFDKLNDKGQETAVERVEELTKIEDYRKHQ